MVSSRQNIISRSLIQNIIVIVNQPWPIPFRKRNAPPTESFVPLLRIDGAGFLEEMDAPDDPGLVREKAGRIKDDFLFGMKFEGEKDFNPFGRDLMLPSRDRDILERLSAIPGANGQLLPLVGSCIGGCKLFDGCSCAGVLSTSLDKGERLDARDRGADVGTRPCAR